MDELWKISWSRLVVTCFLTGRMVCLAGHGLELSGLLPCAHDQLGWAADLGHPASDPTKRKWQLIFLFCVVISYIEELGMFHPMGAVNNSSAVSHASGYVVHSWI